MNEKKILELKHLKIVVLDDADEIFARGFKDIIEDIFSILNQQNIQVLYIHNYLTY